MRTNALHTFCVLIGELPNLGLRPSGFPQFAIGQTIAARWYLLSKRKTSCTKELFYVPEFEGICIDPQIVPDCSRRIGIVFLNI